MFFFFFLWNFYKNINNFNNYYHLVDFFNTMYYPKFTILLKNDLNNLIHIYSNNIVYKFNINHIYNKYELLNIKKINNINVTLKNNILVYFFLLEGFNFNTNNFNLIDFIYDIDVLLIVLELFILLVYFSSYSNYIKVYKKLNIFYDDVIIFFQKNNISLAEFAVFFTLFLGFIFFDIFISFNEDDFLDSFVFFFIILFIFTFFFFFIFLDVQYFYLISSTSNGSYLIRSLIFDIINNLLCILRILICVVRYVSYDLQVEVLDLSFHYIDNNNDFIYYNVYNTNINNFSINNTFNINNINFVLMFKNFFFFF